ncbi:unnamed protein product [Microthlaspi erraticum]|uniref:Uncharacterized protein n=1 Tax=Microthlaspi erraticum TaxID=1685480 RepID=A0A6D2K1Q8_9BRAS|nr:unnamed protein product [Microthlaspi erraticum]
MGHEEHGGTWHMEAAQLDTQRKKGEAILKTSSTVYSTNRSSSSTRPAKLQLDRAGSQKNHASSVAAATKQGKLPGKAIQNPKEQCKVILTQGGLDEEEDQERVMEEFCLLLNDDEIVAAEA